MIETTQCDLLVVGAGPAGLAAATTAARLGVDTVLLDEQAAPGGQIYRAITTTPVTDRAVLGPDYWHGASLVEPFRQSGARYVPGATVWAVAERTATVTWQVLRHLRRPVFLWNVFPLHPHASGGPLPNRCHSRSRTAGFPPPPRMAGLGTAPSHHGRYHEGR